MVHVFIVTLLLQSFFIVTSSGIAGYSGMTYRTDGTDSGMMLAKHSADRKAVADILLAAVKQPKRNVSRSAARPAQQNAGASVRRVQPNISEAVRLAQTNSSAAVAAAVAMAARPAPLVAAAAAAAYVAPAPKRSDSAAAVGHRRELEEPRRRAARSKTPSRPAAHAKHKGDLHFMLPTQSSEIKQKANAQANEIRQEWLKKGRRLDETRAYGLLHPAERRDSYVGGVAGLSKQ
jgi:hypothetical protein